ncbi:MAG: RluA family pseudouridine synthase [Planctomycetaceae bacterium]
MSHDTSKHKTNKKSTRKPHDGDVFHATDEQRDKTLLSALRIWLPDQSWSTLKKLIQNRRVQVHGNLCVDAGRRLKTGDVLKVLPQAQIPVPQPQDVQIRYLDKHIAIVEKPSGMTSCRHAEERHWPARRKQLQPTLDEAMPVVVERYLSNSKKPIASYGDEPGRKGPRKSSPQSKLFSIRPVHRLDRETSGLMVFARTPVAEQKLVDMFRKHDLTRIYRTVIWGQIEAQTIETNLVLDRGDGRRGSTTLHDIGQHAITHVRPIESIGEYSIVECQLETGRTHQIRIHLSELGHPICGDRIYRYPYGSAPIPDHSKAPRVALHAAKLAFQHPVTGEELDFDSEWPADLTEFVRRLRLTTHPDNVTQKSDIHPTEVEDRESSKRVTKTARRADRAEPRKASPAKRARKKGKQGGR